MFVHVTGKQGDFSLDVRFEGRPDGITALYGPSGSGKTSVINMAAGLARPDSGRIVLGGTCVFDAEKRINLPPEKRRIGYVFQEGRLFPHLRVRSNLTYGMRPTSGENRKIPMAQVVDLLGIGHLLNRRPATLSGGEKQRVAIGRALLTSPAVLLMDEPFASLDQARKEELLPYIATINREFSIPILYVSHALREIRALTNSIVRLRNGRVVAGPAEAPDLSFGTDPL